MIRRDATRRDVTRGAAGSGGLSDRDRLMSAKPIGPIDKIGLLAALGRGHIGVDVRSDDVLARSSLAAVQADLASVAKAQARLARYQARLLGEVEERQSAAGARTGSAREMLRDVTGVTDGEARKVTARARRLASQPTVREGLGDGRLSASQADAISAVDVPDEVRARLVDDAVAQSDSETKEAAAVAEREARGDDPEAVFRQQRQSRRGSRWVNARTGMHHYDVALDPVLGGRVDAVLDQAERRLWNSDKLSTFGWQYRKQQQRAADAFVEVLLGAGRCEVSSLADVTEAPVASAVVPKAAPAQTAPVTMHVTVGLDVLRAEVAAGCGCGDAGVTDAGVALSASELRRLACDANVVPWVLGSQSQPLDVGRSVRVVSDAQRRALILRDIGCVYPGCTAPPNQCEAHHLKHWADNGPTDLANLALVCFRHHRHLHARGDVLRRVPTGESARMVFEPTWPEGSGDWVILNSVGREVARQPDVSFAAGVSAGSGTGQASDRGHVQTGETTAAFAGDEVVTNAVPLAGNVVEGERAAVTLEGHPAVEPVGSDGGDGLQTFALIGSASHQESS